MTMGLPHSGSRLATKRPGALPVWAHDHTGVFKGADEAGTTSTWFGNAWPNLAALDNLISPFLVRDMNYYFCTPCFLYDSPMPSP